MLTYTETGGRRSQIYFAALDIQSQRAGNGYKVAIAYAVIAWLLMQIATQVFPFLESDQQFRIVGETKEQVQNVREAVSPETN